MSKRSPRARPRRKRVGRVSYYEHHNSWWIYYRQSGQQIRRKAGDSEETAERIASEINGQLTCCRPTQFDFVPISITELRQKFLDYHETILRPGSVNIRRR